MTRLKTRPAHSCAGAVLIALAGCDSSAPVTTKGASARAIADGCFALRAAATGRDISAAGDGYVVTDGPATPFHLKPSGIGTYLPFDADRRLPAAHDGDAVGRDAAAGPASEWRLEEAAGGTYAIVSTATQRRLAVAPSGAIVQAASDAPAARFMLHPEADCASFPEAEVGATGTPFAGANADGTVAGFADLHVHVTASLRAGGQVISGEPFHRFGIPAALGNDAEVHGPQGSLDATGNLLRSGSPAGTHGTDGWPTFAGWPVHDTYTHQQTYYVWLQRAWMAGMRLMVAMTVEDAPLCEIEPRRSHSCDEGATIELQVAQLRELQDYVDAQAGGPGRGWFRLVEDPWAARRVIEQGRLAVVIGVESSGLFGCTERLRQPQCTRDDIDRGVAQLASLGIRSVFPVHWVDNAFGGAALEGGDKGVFIGAMQVKQTGQPFSTGPCPIEGQGEPDPTGTRVCNTHGLTELGEHLIGRLMDHGLLIEMDHMSERARLRVLEIAEARRYPLVSSHTHTGGPWTGGELDRLYALGGIASARVDQAPGLATAIGALAPHRSGAFFFGVPLSTDVGGFAALPAPRASPLAYPFSSYLGDVYFERQRTGERIYDLGADGVAHYGLVPDLLADVQRETGSTALEPLFQSAEAYLQMWERATLGR